jgi:spectinomycin phosphotransferase
VLTKPTDLADAEVSAALRTGWGFRAKSLEYLTVGGGSHHWLATDGCGGQQFLAVTELPVFLRDRADTTAALLGRLRAALLTALALREQARLEFVVAPIRRDDDEPLSRLSERYCLIVYRYLDGTHAGEDGQYRNASHRRTVLDLLVQIHRVRTEVARADDFVLPHRGKLELALDDSGRTWDGGPYAERARHLLLDHAAGLEKLTAAYEVLAERIAARPERFVVTHGEPHAGNVMVTSAGLMLIDWDTALLAPPERDLWTLAEDDESLLDRYAAATGLELDQDALSFYRLWFDLAEVGQYLGQFHDPHDQSADSAEGWANLHNHLRPAERWPGLAG